VQLCVSVSSPSLSFSTGLFIFAIVPPCPDKARLHLLPFPFPSWPLLDIYVSIHILESACCVLRNLEFEPGTSHAYNPSYSRGKDQEDHSSKPAWANSSPDPTLKQPTTK
jgi:hypothetical protein